MNILTRLNKPFLKLQNFNLNSTKLKSFNPISNKLFSQTLEYDFKSGVSGIEKLFLCWFIYRGKRVSVLVQELRRKNVLY